MTGGRAFHPYWGRGGGFPALRSNQGFPALELANEMAAAVEVAAEGLPARDAGSPLENIFR
jgi:hypothetical protein